MAIKEILKSTAQGIVSKNLKRVAGNLGSLVGGSQRTNSSDFEGINRSKSATKMLSFPIDVVNADPATGGNHGHYIMFEINEQVSAKLKFGDVADSQGGIDTAGRKNLAEEMRSRGGEVSSTKVYDSKKKKYIKEANPEVFKIFFNDGDPSKGQTEAAKAISKSYATGKSVNKNPSGDKTNTVQTISVHRAPTKRLDTVITMFMPADVKVNYKSNFTDQTIGAGAQAASQIIGEVVSTGTFNTDTIMRNAGDLATRAGRDALLSILSVAPIFEGSKEAIEIGMGAALTDRMEMAFKGIDKRKFQYTFKMMPRSQDESDEIKKIVDMFKFHMLPEMLQASSRGRLMGYPSTFDIKYMYQNAENNYLNKVSECYLESMDVDYGGDRYRTFKPTSAGAPPTEVTLTLNFGEIELITRERAIEGY